MIDENEDSSYQQWYETQALEEYFKELENERTRKIESSKNEIAKHETEKIRA